MVHMSPDIKVKDKVVVDGGPLQHWSARSISCPGERLMIIDSFMML